MKKFHINNDERNTSNESTSISWEQFKPWIVPLGILTLLVVVIRTFTESTPPNQNVDQSRPQPQVERGRLSLKERCQQSFDPTHKATWPGGWALIDASKAGQGGAVVCSPLTEGEVRTRLNPGEGSPPGYHWGDQLPNGSLNLHEDILVEKIR